MQIAQVRGLGGFDDVSPAIAEAAEAYADAFANSLAEDGVQMSQEEYDDIRNAAELQMQTKAVQTGTLTQSEALEALELMELEWGWDSINPVKAIKSVGKKVVKKVKKAAKKAGGAALGKVKGMAKKAIKKAKSMAKKAANDALGKVGLNLKDLGLDKTKKKKKKPAAKVVAKKAKKKAKKKKKAKIDVDAWKAAYAGSSGSLVPKMATLPDAAPSGGMNKKTMMMVGGGVAAAALVAAVVIAKKKKKA